MNSSLFTADRVTHVKIVVVALLFATMVAGVSVGARIANYETGGNVQAVYKAGQPMTSAGSDAAVIIH